MNHLLMSRFPPPSPLNKSVVPVPALHPIKNLPPSPIPLSTAPSHPPHRPHHRHPFSSFRPLLHLPLLMQKKEEKKKIKLF